jgi:hypothetical protein
MSSWNQFPAEQHGLRPQQSGEQLPFLASFQAATFFALLRQLSFQDQPKVIWEQLLPSLVAAKCLACRFRAGRFSRILDSYCKPAQ